MMLLCEIFSIAANPKKFSAAIFQKLILNPCEKIFESQSQIDAKQVRTSIPFSTCIHDFLKKYTAIIVSSQRII